MRCVSMAAPITLASLNPHSPESPPQPLPQPKPRRPRPQPSVVQIERAIGAGIFRDRDPRGSEQSKTLFDLLLSNSIGKTEGSVEKKLRETGEWISDRAERTSRSTEKQILGITFLWVLPMWTLLLLVAAGILKLPFSIPFLDNLLMPVYGTNTFVPFNWSMVGWEKARLIVHCWPCSNGVGNSNGGGAGLQRVLSFRRRH